MDIIQHNMTVQEVFNTPAIKEIEQQILLLFDKSKNNWRSGDADTDTIAIRSLLEVRKNLLNSLFVLDEENKQLLTDFNEALKKQLLDTRDRTIKMMEAVKSAGFSGEIFAQGKCYLGYDYPLIHPVQSNRAKKCGVFLMALMIVICRCMKMELKVQSNIILRVRLLQKTMCCILMMNPKRTGRTTGMSILIESLALTCIWFMLSITYMNMSVSLYSICYGFATLMSRSTWNMTILHIQMDMNMMIQIGTRVTF